MTANNLNRKAVIAATATAMLALAAGTMNVGAGRPASYVPTTPGHPTAVGDSTADFFTCYRADGCDPDAPVDWVFRSNFRYVEVWTDNGDAGQAAKIWVSNANLCDGQFSIPDGLLPDGNGDDTQIVLTSTDTHHVSMDANGLDGWAVRGQINMGHEYNYCRSLGLADMYLIPYPTATVIAPTATNTPYVAPDATNTPDATATPAPAQPESTSTAEPVLAQPTATGTAIIDIGEPPYWTPVPTPEPVTTLVPPVNTDWIKYLPVIVRY